MKGKIVKEFPVSTTFTWQKPEFMNVRQRNFRNQKIKPLVGDDVEIVVLDEEKRLEM